jgi:peroxiredoxin
MSLMQQKFSMSSQHLPNGKKAITIAPISESELDQSKKEKEIFINSLLGKKLAGFSFQDINGKKLDSNGVKGKMVVMNFWFTGCKPCIAEMPELNKLVNDYKEKNTVFIAVSFDNKETIQKFITKRPFNYNLVTDQQSYIDKLNATGYPVHIITDTDGIVRKVVVGFNEDTIEQLRNTMEKMINKQ